MSNSGITNLSILLVVALTSGCGDDSEPPPPTGGDNQATEIIPLTTGNKWVWETTTFDSGGLITGARLDSSVIINQTIIASETWYINQFNTLSINRVNGYWVAIQPEITSSLLYKYPASVSDWYLYGLPNSDEFLVMVMSVSETVVIPPDTFLCYKYRSYKLGGGGVDTSYHYIEPGTGLARKDVFDGLGRLKSRQVLSRITLVQTQPVGGEPE